MEDLNKAFDMIEQVIDITPHRSAHRAGILNYFGTVFSRRFRRTKSIENLNRAVKVSDMAVNATP